LGALVLVASALTSPALGSVSVSSDVGVTLAGSAVADEDVVVDDLLGGIVPASLGSLPGNADVTACHRLANGDQLFALDTATVLPGSVAVRPGDVIRYDGASYSTEFDASAAGDPIRRERMR
jgi:hypothetical protein